MFENAQALKGIFQDTVSHNYQLAQKCEIFTGLDLYDTILKAWTTQDHETRKRFKEFQKFIGETFFGEENVEIFSIIPQEKGENPHIRLSLSDTIRELYHYGDGVQAIMLLTYPLFMADEGTCFFIEEPELNLHPALQREFLKVLTENEVITKKN